MPLKAGGELSSSAAEKTSAWPLLPRRECKSPEGRHRSWRRIVHPCRAYSQTRRNPRLCPGLSAFPIGERRMERLLDASPIKGKRRNGPALCKRVVTRQYYLVRRSNFSSALRSFSICLRKNSCSSRSARLISGDMSRCAAASSAAASGVGSTVGRMSTINSTR
jgi:hypothetical protein